MRATKSMVGVGLQSLLVVLMFGVGVATGDPWVSVAPDGTVSTQEAIAGNPPQVTPSYDDAGGLHVTVVTAGFTVAPRKTKGGEFVEVTWPDAPVAGEIGTPGLPVVRRLFIAPPGTTVEVSTRNAEPVVIDAETVGFSLRVMPVQPPIPKIPGARENADFVFDESAYGLDADLLAHRAVVQELGIVRGQRLFLLEVRPVDYNPVTGTLAFWPNIEIEIGFVGEPGPATPLSPLPGLQHILLNPVPSAPQARGSGNYLIVVASVFEADIAAFAAAKEAQGFTVTTHPVAAGTSNSAIKSYIQGLWNGGPDTAPDYVLLVGDTDKIPHWTGGGDGSPATDLPYGCMDGAADWYPDIAIGRFPVDDATELQTMVSKALYYENGPLADPDYKKRAVFMASVDNYQISEGTHEYVINTWLEPNGYECDRLYQVTYGATTQDVRNSFNDGRFYGVYSGHGGTDSWADGPPFSKSDVNNLTNQNMYAFICSFACLTGQYTADECFMETWVLAPNKAAVASWGSSVTSYWTEDDILEKRLFDAIFDNEDEVKTEAGPIYNETRMRFLDHFGATSTTRRYFEMYNLMGDPALPLPSTCSDAGEIALDRTEYMCETTAVIQVADCGLNADDGVVETVEVTIASDSEPAGESVVLTETDAASAQFVGSIQLRAIDDAGVLQIAEGDTIIATYIDADDGQGGTNVTVTATATADCTPPVISNVHTTDIEPRSAKVAFTTDEPAQGTVHYGLSCGALVWTASGGGYATAPVVSVTGLQDDTTYFYTVDAEDEAGNVASDDNFGVCYSFTTPEVPDYFTELFESDNDLDDVSLIFTPDGSNDFYRGCAEPIDELPTDPSGGTTLSFSPSNDDGYAGVTLSGGETVSLYGTEYSNFYVGSNGYITFGGGDSDYTETLADHFDMPRISGVFDDLNPGSSGTVSWKQVDDRVAVTWQNVPEYSSTGSNTFQIEMYFDGTIAINFLSCTVADGLAGLSEGMGLDPDFYESDLSAMGDCAPPDCNGNGVPDDQDIAGGTSEDCNANEIPDECDVGEGGGSPDTNGNGIPDECEAQAPVVAAEGSRYVAVTLQPPDSALPVALLVTGDPKDPDVSCVSFYVQESGVLSTLPVFQTPAAWGGTVHVRGGAIIPQTTYYVQAERPDGHLTTNVIVVTWMWGDVEHNLTINLADIMRILEGFQGDFSQATRENMDQQPCDPDGILNLDDVMAAISAFQGVLYSDTNCPTPCE